ncbi:MAG TPA: crosslink repair DNA glycosylase YcaQ family protein [Frankiaceae bacterium]|nr:crosslink repair DNA glycosylase YcaQ family protein [Frankiaceae bacterium]
MTVTREQVLAYRAARHGLAPGTAPDGALLDLGVQDTPAGSAALALSARGLAGDGLVTVWSFRGAPHRHRAGDLRALSKATWPLSEPDAYARLGGLGATLKKAGRSGVEAIATTARAVRDLVADGTAKGELSAAVTAAIPDEYSFWCRGCGATHVHDQLLRLSALHGGALLATSTPLTFGRIERWSGPPARAEGAERLLRAYLTLHGPATPADAAGYLGSGGPHVKAVWPEGLAEVRVEGRQAWLPEEAAGALRDAAPVPFTRLVPPSDPYLQARDRALLVPDAAHRKALWTVLAGPGAVVADGEVAGLWRAKQAGKGRLRLTVTPWRAVDRAAVEEEAARVAAVRGTPSVEVAFER